MRRLLPLLLLIAPATGCNQPRKLPELYPVKGQLKQNGEPVKGGFVNFQARERSEGLSLIVNSPVDQDGRFELTTISDDAARLPGAPKGVYDVTYTPAGGGQRGKSMPSASSQHVSIEGENTHVEVDLVGSEPK